MANNLTTYSTLIQQWLETFVPAYRGVLPSNETPSGSKYILYTPYYEPFATQFIQPIFIYDEGATGSYDGIMEVVDRIEKAVGDGGIVLHNTAMNIKICKGSPFYQDYNQSTDENTKAGYVNLLITIYQKER